MLRWLDDGGAEIALIRVTDRARVRRDVVDGEPVFEIPLRQLITIETARASAIGRAVAATHLDLSGQTWIALYLLEERRATDSFWRPYLAVLPRRLPHIPLFFEERELALLEGTSLLEAIRERRAQLAAEYEALCAHVSGIDSFSLEEFLVARATVDSRAFRIDVFGENTLALVPLADLIDHAAQPGTVWQFDDAKASFVLQATEPLPRGAIVYDTYGAKGNAALLQFYGFSLEDNAHDTAVIRGVAVTADLDTEATQELFAGLREETRDGDADAARLLLLETCTRALERIRSDVPKRLSRNARNAVLARESERRVLEFFRRFAADPASADRIAPLRRYRAAQWQG